MGTIDGIKQAYSHQYKDKSRDTRGGWITQAEFLKLESGHYGDVSIVELQTILDRYEYPFIQILRESEALSDPLLIARLGPKAAEYIALHAEVARQWHKAQYGFEEENRHGIDGIRLGGASDTSSTRARSPIRSSSRWTTPATALTSTIRWKTAWRWRI
jgi:hypothetical protein